MTKKRWSQLWFCLACTIVMGYGALMYNISEKDMAYKEQQEWEYQRDIRELKEQLASNQVVFVERMAATKHEATVLPILKRLKPRGKLAELTAINDAVVKYSEQYELPAELVVYLIKRESNFNTRAFSSVGAVGLMQVFPKWHRDKMMELGITHEEVYNIDNNVRLGCWILRQYLDRTGSIDKALTKYVGGKHPSYVRDILSGYTNEMIYMK